MPRQQHSLNYIAMNPVHARHTHESKFKYPAKYFLKSCAMILKTAFIYFLETKETSYSSTL
jgi:hypothetical protein